MGEENCIYVDAERKWWTAEIKDDIVLGSDDIILIKEQTEELQIRFKKDFVEFINLIAPHILFCDEKGDLHGADPRDRNISYLK